MPCAWVLMTRKTTLSYNSVWEAIKELCPNFKPTRAMSDFEKALMKSLRDSFPGIVVKGCYFHICQVIDF